ncbi:MAG TPA: flavodoxin family protein [Thermoleophilia bacterium]|nr:flavodoxin family protein [Thermoleophilia bacterium]
MKILAIGGSPRPRGNSNSLMRIAVESAVERGAAAEVFRVKKMNIQGCDACDGCKAKPDATCVVEDDMHQIYDRLKACDVLVLATPVYFYYVSSWLKAVIDRLYGLMGPKVPDHSVDYGLYEPRVEPGKSYYVITTQEEKPLLYGYFIMAGLAQSLGWFDMTLKGQLIATELSKASDWKKRPDLIEAARQLIVVPSAESDTSQAKPA